MYIVPEVHVSVLTHTTSDRNVAQLIVREGDAALTTRGAGDDGQ